MILQEVVQISIANTTIATVMCLSEVERLSSGTSRNPTIKHNFVDGITPRTSFMVRHVSLVGVRHSGAPANFRADYVHQRDVARLFRSRILAGQIRHIDSWLKALTDRYPVKADCHTRDIEWYHNKCMSVVAKYMAAIQAQPPDYPWQGLCNVIHNDIRDFWILEADFTPRPPGSTWRSSLHRTHINHRFYGVFRRNIERAVGWTLFRKLFRVVDT